MQFNQTLSITIEKMLETNLIPMLLGEPGIGKSSYLEALAKKYKTKCFTLACNQLADKTDLTGARLIPAEKDGEYKQVFFPHATIQEAIQYAIDHPRQKPILFLDEINRTTSDVTSALLSLPTSRKIGHTELPKNLRIVIAGNDKGNVTTLDEASISRFVKIHVQPDISTFLSLDLNLHPAIVKVLQQNPQTLFGKTVVTNNTSDDQKSEIEELLDDNDMAQITTPRTIHALSNWLNAMDPKELLNMLSIPATSHYGDTNALQEIIEGFTGYTLFTLHLMNELSSSLTINTSSSNTLIIGKPQMYDDIQQAKTYNELVNSLASLDNDELSSVLLYALYEKKDNTLLISTLTKTLHAFSKDDIATLIRLNQNDELDEENMKHLMSLDAPITQILSAII